MRNFKVLFYFSSPDYSLIETKRLDLPESAAPGDVYKWLVFEHATSEFTNLTFKSMKKEGLLEYRSFQEAELSFDVSEAQLQIQDGSMVFNRQSVEDVSDELNDKLGSYLLNADNERHQTL